MSKHQNWENGSFEEFIRKSVENPQLEFDPEAWEAMEKKLDSQAGGTGFAGSAGKIGAVLLALLLMSLLGWFMLGGTGEKDSIAAPEKQEEQVLSEPAGTVGENAAAPEQQQETLGLKERAEQQSVGGGDAENTSTSARGVSRKKRLSAPGNRREGAEENSSAAASPKPAGSFSSQGKEADETKSGIPGALPGHGINSDDRGNTEGGLALEKALSVDEKGNGQRLQRKPWQAFDFGGVDMPSISLPLPQFPVQGAGKEEKVVPASHRKMPLGLSLSLAPDFSGTAEPASTRLGAGAGLHLEYRILPRIGLVTGLVYSQKNYLVSGSSSSYDFGYYRPKPDFIDGSCGVLDIPLNLRYYIFQGRRHSFFLSSGLSSYLMKREVYKLLYASGQYGDFTYEVRNENRHYFGVYNFSAGYETRISPRWALQVEPFLKIPANGVGVGSIRLNSMGAFIHLKYAIGRQGK